MKRSMLIFLNISASALIIAVNAAIMYGYYRLCWYLEELGRALGRENDKVTYAVVGAGVLGAILITVAFFSLCGSVVLAYNAYAFALGAPQPHSSSFETVVNNPLPLLYETIINNPPSYETVADRPPAYRTVAHRPPSYYCATREAPPSYYDAVGMVNCGSEPNTSPSAILEGDVLVASHLLGCCAAER